MFYDGLGYLIAYTIAIARDDDVLRELAFKRICTLYHGEDGVPDRKTIERVLSEVQEIMIFMKAATSKNRADPKILGDIASLP